jgi:hypothetical protein
MSSRRSCLCQEHCLLTWSCHSVVVDLIARYIARSASALTALSFGVPATAFAGVRILAPLYRARTWSRGLESLAM